MENELENINPEFKATMDSNIVSRIKKCVTVLDGDKAYVNIAEHEIYIRGMSEDHEIMVDITLPADSMKEYIAYNPGVMLFPFDRIPSLYEGNVEIYQSISNRYGIDNRMLCFRQGYIVQSRLIGDLYGNMYKLPDCSNHNVVMVVPLDSIKKMLKGVKNEYDTIVFTAEERKITASDEEENTSVSIADADADSDMAVRSDATGPVRETYSMAHILHAIRGAPNKSQITLSYTQESPLVIQYNIWDGVRVRYYIAPKLR